MSKGLVIVISAPSGTGKSTICQRLLKSRKNIRYSVTCTTRPPRDGEADGRHYFFVGREEFKKRIRSHEFIEWAMVHDHYYGVPRAFLEDCIGKGIDVVLAIDVQGGRTIRRKFPESVLIFVLPPSIGTLRERLQSRREGSDSLAKRLANSRGELGAAKSYDYLVVNDDLDKAVAQISAVITAESLRLSRRRHSDLDPLVR
ncbi:MAG: guanylate kinase [Elusimicrobia bacterium]|nr:guanylate kinase [Elusimicrobiota bacterium]